MTKFHGPNFLVVGLQRSGTHWITAMLNAHPEISCFPSLAFQSESGKLNKIGEVHIFNTLASLVPGNEERFTKPFSDFLTKYNRYFFDLVQYKDHIPNEQLFRMFIERYNKHCESQRNGKNLVGESTPAYIFHLDFIDSFYPNIKKLCIIRDVKDRIVSFHFNLLRKGKKNEAEITEEFIKEYCEKRVIPEYTTMLEYSGNVHCFTYEKLYKEQEKVISGILDYLRVENSQHIVQNMIKEGAFKNVTAKDSVMKKSRNPGEESIQSHYRKGIVGDWKNYLNEDQSRMVDEIVRDSQKKVFEKYGITS